MKRILAIAFIAATLAGCAIGSGSIDWKEARKVKAGMDKQQVTELMGKPYMKVSKAQGVETWTWMHVSPITFASSRAYLTFRDGKLISGFPDIPEDF
jgi:hypothetical protein